MIKSPYYYVDTVVAPFHSYFPHVEYEIRSNEQKVCSEIWLVGRGMYGDLIAIFKKNREEKLPFCDIFSEQM